MYHTISFSAFKSTLSKLSHSYPPHFFVMFYTVILSAFKSSLFSKLCPLLYPLIYHTANFSSLDTHVNPQVFQFTLSLSLSPLLCTIQSVVKHLSPPFSKLSSHSPPPLLCTIQAVAQHLNPPFSKLPPPCPIPPFAMYHTVRWSAFTPLYTPSPSYTIQLTIFHCVIILCPIKY